MEALRKFLKLSLFTVCFIFSISSLSNLYAGEPAGKGGIIEEVTADEALLPEGGQEVSGVVVEQSAEVALEIIIEEAQPGTPTDTFKRRVLPRDLVGERPEPNDVPTPVKIGIFIFDVPYIEDAKQTFKADFRFVLRWKDPRLAHDKDGIKKVNIDDIWNPMIRVLNQREVSIMEDEVAYISPDGHVLYGQRYVGRFTVPLNLKDFPRDDHQLYIRTLSYYGPEEIQLIIDEDLTGWSRKLSVPDWEVSNGEAKINTNYSDLQKREMAQMEFTFDVHRYFGFYFWKIVIPLALIVFMSWGVFWIEPKRLEAQVALAATTFLTLFAYQFAIASHLPKVTYLTRMDIFTMLSSVLVFLALLEALFKGYCSKKDWIDLAVMTDRFSRVLFPAAFAGIIYFAFVR